MGQGVSSGGSLRTHSAGQFGRHPSDRVARKEPSTSKPYCRSLAMGRNKAGHAIECHRLVTGAQHSCSSGAPESAMLRTAAAAAFLVRQFEDGYVKSCAAGVGASRSTGSGPPAESVHWLRGVGQASQRPRSLAHLRRQSSRAAVTAGPVRRRRISVSARRFRFEILRRRSRRGLDLPLTAQSRPAVAQRPATDERRARDRQPLTGAAKIHQVVIGRRKLRRSGRRVIRPNNPESCESFEHRSPPLPLCAAGR
jgi:hypothetical protein